ncbi:MAG: hypothetical protein H8M99_09615 [Gloeobacteraceae cyanobacterium ES-bin-144]|nr:hypothetical protein [Verrucomicrobiales bacterium]
MKSILYVVSILAVGGAIYFTLSHKKKFEDLQKDRLATIETNTDITAKAVVKESDLKAEREALAASEQKREETVQRLDTLKSNGSSLEREVAELDVTIKSQEVEFVELKKTLDEVALILKDLGGDVTLDNLPEKIQQVQDDLKAKQTKLEETQTLVASAEKLLEKNRAESDRMTRRDIERNSKISRNAMQAVVTAVNQDWGFIVIGAGSNSGFTPQTSLIVEREGRMIGRITPSSIEPTQTIAEIDFKSLATGVRIQPGDHVMLAKPVSQ